MKLLMLIAMYTGVAVPLSFLIGNVLYHAVRRWRSRKPAPRRTHAPRLPRRVRRHRPHYRPGRATPR